MDIFHKEAPAHYDALVEFHNANPFLSRSPTMLGCAKQILGLEGDEAKELAQAWVELYTKLTRQRVMDCCYIPGAKELIEDLKKQFPILLASATPEGEVMKIVEARGITKLFDSIHGAPIDKTKVIQEFMSKHDCKPEEFLYIGDSELDRIASRDAGVYFIGMDQGKEFPGFVGPVVADHYAIRPLLTETFGVQL